MVKGAYLNEGKETSRPPSLFLESLILLDLGLVGVEMMNGGRRAEMGVFIGCGMVCMLEKVENGLKLLFKLSSNVWCYARTFSVLLPNGSRVAN